MGRLGVTHGVIFTYGHFARGTNDLDNHGDDRRHVTKEGASRRRCMLDRIVLSTTNEDPTKNHLGSRPAGRRAIMRKRSVA